MTTDDTPGIKRANTRERKVGIIGAGSTGAHLYCGALMSHGDRVLWNNMPDAVMWSYTRARTDIATRQGVLAEMDAAVSQLADNGCTAIAIASMSLQPLLGAVMLYRPWLSMIQLPMLSFMYGKAPLPKIGVLGTPSARHSIQWYRVGTLGGLPSALNNSLELAIRLKWFDPRADVMAHLGPVLRHWRSSGVQRVMVASASLADPATMEALESYGIPLYSVPAVHIRNISKYVQSAALETTAAAEETAPS